MAGIQQNYRKLLERNLDTIRIGHENIRKELRADPNFQYYAGVAAMLAALRAQRHRLAVVSPQESAVCAEDLRRARLWEYFDGAVYGIDAPRSQGASLKDVYTVAVQNSRLDETAIRVRRNDDEVCMAVDHTFEGISAGHETGHLCVAAYVGDCPDAHVAAQAEMFKLAGADFIASTPTDINNLLGNASAYFSIKGKKVRSGLPAGMPVLNFGAGPA